jgi:hypothetical protein
MNYSLMLAGHNQSLLKPDTRQQPSSMSVIRSIEDFSHAVQQMKETVLVPHQLKDIRYRPTAPLTQPQRLTSSSTTSSLDTCASADTSSSSTYSNVADELAGAEPSLLSCYKMIEAVHNDLSNGGSWAFGELQAGVRTASSNVLAPGDRRSSLPVVLTGHGEVQQLSLRPTFGAHLGGSRPFSIDLPPTPPGSPAPGLAKPSDSIYTVDQRSNAAGDGENDVEIEVARQIRQHVHNFLHAVRQLTELAQLLTEKYQENLDGQ